jgi:hypothetical protein
MLCVWVDDDVHRLIPVFSLFQLPMHPRFGKGVMDCVIMWVSNVNATIKINKKSVMNNEKENIDSKFILNGTSAHMSY